MCARARSKNRARKKPLAICIIYIPYIECVKKNHSYKITTYEDCRIEDPTGTVIGKKTRIGPVGKTEKEVGAGVGVALGVRAPLFKILKNFLKIFARLFRIFQKILKFSRQKQGHFYNE